VEKLWNPSLIPWLPGKRRLLTRPRGVGVKASSDRKGYFPHSCAVKNAPFPGQ